MRIIDISVPLRAGMPSFPGDPSFAKAAAKSRAAGDPCEVSSLTLGSHAGTHVDVPLHFVAGGADLDRVGLEPFAGPCYVADVGGKRAVDAAAVAATVPAGPRRILFKTDNGRLWRDASFRRDFVFLTADGARALVTRGAALVGWDYLSVEAFDAPSPEAHRELLGAGVVILEGVNLSAVAPGPYYLIAFPLKIEGGDGSPVRAVLLDTSPP